MVSSGPIPVCSRVTKDPSVTTGTKEREQMKRTSRGPDTPSQILTIGYHEAFVFSNECVLVEPF